MRAEVKKSNVATEFWTEERCYIAETANDSLNPTYQLLTVNREPK